MLLLLVVVAVMPVEGPRLGQLTVVAAAGAALAAGFGPAHVDRDVGPKQQQQQRRRRQLLRPNLETPAAKVPKGNTAPAAAAAAGKPKPKKRRATYHEEDPYHAGFRSSTRQQRTHEDLTSIGTAAGAEEGLDGLAGHISTDSWVFDQDGNLAAGAPVPAASCGGAALLAAAEAAESSAGL